LARPRCSVPPRGGHVEVVRYLLSTGADCNIAESTGGYTPLHWAASHGNLETIEALVEAGADPTVADRQGRLPIDMARKHGFRQMYSLDAADNQPMQELAAYLGFKRSLDPGDPSQAIHTLAL